MSLLYKVYRAIGHPRIRRRLPHTRWGDHLHAYLWFLRVHLRRPGRSTFNDRVYWMHVSDEIRDPLRVFVSDKENVKQFIAEKIGAEYAVPTLQVLHSDAEIDAFTPTQPSVIKPTHSSGEVMFCNPDAPVDKDLLKSWLRLDFYAKKREANYKDLPKKLIVEPALFAPEEALDFKVYCVDGVPRMIKVDFDRFNNRERKLYDTDWTPLPYSWTVPLIDRVVDRPANFDEVLSLAARLSAPFSFIRVDFYLVGDAIYVGEVTNCESGIGNLFFPPEAEHWCSDLLFGPAARGTRW